MPPSTCVPHTISAHGPMRSSTEGPSAPVHMRPPHPFRDTSHTLRGPIASSTEGRSATVHM
eukprot:146433-Pyramimonas_sp.AAC.1